MNVLSQAHKTGINVIEFFYSEDRHFFCCCSLYANKDLQRLVYYPVFFYLCTLLYYKDEHHSKLSVAFDWAEKENEKPSQIFAWMVSFTTNETINRKKKSTK